MAYGGGSDRDLGLAVHLAGRAPGGYRSRWPWLALLVALGALYLWRNLVQVAPTLGEGISDFLFYYRAASAILSGESPFVVANFIYPPLLSFLVVPLGLLSYTAARLVWFSLDHVFLLGAALWTWRGLGGDSAALWSVALTWVAAGSVAVTLRDGQINCLLLFLVCITLWRPARFPSLPVLALGAGIALKLLPGVLLAGDLLRRQWGRMLYTVGVAACLVAGPSLIVALTLDGPATPPRAGFLQGTPAFLSGSLPALALRLLDPATAGEPLPSNWLRGNLPEGLELDPGHAKISVAVAMVSFLAGFLVIAMMLGLREEPPEESALGAALLALVLVVAPLSWPHYQVLQLPGTALLGLALFRHRRRLELALLVVGFLVLNWNEAIVMGPYLETYGRTAHEPLLVWLLSSSPIAAGLLVFALHCRGLRRPVAPL